MACCPGCKRIQRALGSFEITRRKCSGMTCNNVKAAKRDSNPTVLMDRMLQYSVPFPLELFYPNLSWI